MMFYEIAEVLRDRHPTEHLELIEVLAKIELLAKREVLVELYNALEDRKGEISKEELMKVIADEIENIEELIDYFSRNFKFDLDIARKKPKITAIIR